MKNPLILVFFVLSFAVAIDVREHSKYQRHEIHEAMDQNKKRALMQNALYFKNKDLTVTYESAGVGNRSYSTHRSDSKSGKGGSSGSGSKSGKGDSSRSHSKSGSNGSGSKSGSHRSGSKSGSHSGSKSGSHHSGSKSGSHRSGSKSGDRGSKSGGSYVSKKSSGSGSYHSVKKMDKRSGSRSDDDCGQYDSGDRSLRAGINDRDDAKVDRNKEDKQRQLRGSARCSGSRSKGRNRKDKRSGSKGHRLSRDSAQ